MTNTIDYDFGSVGLEWHMYRNQDVTHHDLRRQIEEAWDEAESLESEFGDSPASAVDTDDVLSSVLVDELLECDESPLCDIVGNFEDAHQHLEWMLEDFDGATLCGAFEFRKSITTDEQREKLANVK